MIIWGGRDRFTVGPPKLTIFKLSQRDVPDCCTGLTHDQSKHIGHNGGRVHDLEGRCMMMKENYDRAKERPS